MGRLTYRDPNRSKSIKEHYDRDELAFSNAPTYEILNRLAYYEDMEEAQSQKEAKK